MAVQPTLSLSPDYLARLIVKIGSPQAREPEVDPNPESNAIDDRMVDSLQDTRGDLSREEVHEELRGLNERQPPELVHSCGSRAAVSGARGMGASH